MANSTNIYDTYPATSPVYKRWRKIINAGHCEKVTEEFLVPEIALPKLNELLQYGKYLVYVGDILEKEHLGFDTILVCREQHFRMINKKVTGKGLRWVLASSRKKGTYYGSVRFCTRNPKYIGGCKDKLDAHFKAMRYFIDTMIKNRDNAVNQDVMQGVIDAWEYRYNNRLPVYYKEVSPSSPLKSTREYEEREEANRSIYNKLLTSKTFSQTLA